MISLTYLSTATTPFSPSSLNEPLSTTRGPNQANDLTGMLLYAGGHFIQTLEGAQEVVDATFDRIERDARHRDVYVALRDDFETRAGPCPSRPSRHSAGPVSFTVCSETECAEA